MGYFRKLSASVQFMIKSALFKGKIYSDGEEQIRDILEVREAFAIARVRTDLSS